jgi:hypothetical protein
MLCLESRVDRLPPSVRVGVRVREELTMDQGRYIFLYSGMKKPVIQFVIFIIEKHATEEYTNSI